MHGPHVSIILIILTASTSSPCLTGEDDTCFEQPVILNEDHGLYNVRKLSLLPHFLTQAGWGYELQRLLMDYEWLRASASSVSCLDLVAEFAAVLPLVPIAR